MFKVLKYPFGFRVHFKRYEDSRLYYVSAVCLDKRNIVPGEYLELSNQTMKHSKRKRLNIFKSVSKKEYLYGISPCLAALDVNRRKFYAIFINVDAENMKTRPQFKEIKSLAEKRVVTTKIVSRKKLDNLCGNRPHQNIVMKVGNLSMISFVDTEDLDSSDLNANKRPPFWIVLEGIQDPMNMGAILRTSAYLGVDKVVTSHSNSCSLTPSVSKASAGAMEVLPLYSANIMQLLKKKRAENWQILGTVHPNFHPHDNLAAVVTCNQYHLDKPSVLVLGNEGSGLSAEAQTLCTTFLTIPSQMRHQIGDLDSLNVSVATGILLHSLLTSRDH